MSTVEGEQDRSVRPGRAWEGELSELPTFKRDGHGVRSGNTESQRTATGVSAVCCCVTNNPTAGACDSSESVFLTILCTD